MTIGQQNDEIKRESKGDEMLTCAGCSHPIHEDQPVIVILSGESESPNSHRQRAPWTQRLAGLCSGLVGAVALFGSGLENLFNALPTYLRDALSEHKEDVRGFAKGAASFAVIGGKRVALLLARTPHIAAIAVGAVLVVGLSAGAVHAYSSSNNRKESSENSDALYFHAACPDCGGQSCFPPFIDVEV